MHEIVQEIKSMSRWAADCNWKKWRL